MSTNFRHVKLALQLKRDEVASRLRKLEDISVERLPDPMDNLEMLREREAAITQLDQDSRLLRDIDAALRRIDDGEYGRCITCEAEIGERRLGAVPWTAYCVSCQAEVDQARAQQEFRQGSPG